MTEDRLRGQGRLRMGTIPDFEADFVLSRWHWHFQFELNDVDKPARLHAGIIAERHWNLVGDLEDGREVRSASLICTSSSPQPVFFPLKGVVIGTAGSGEIEKAEFPLTGAYYSPSISVWLSNWSISIENPVHWASHTSWEASSVGRALESKVLSLRSPGATLADCWAKAKCVATILALALGQGVTAHRQFYNWSSGKSLEIWRQTSGDQNGPGLLVPPDKLTEYIEIALPTWESWSTEKQELVARVIQYLNMSHNGVLDVRILYVAQALEALSLEWVKPQKIGAELEQLKSLLKAAWKRWRSDSERDPSGFWAGRISKLFEWPRLRLQLEELFRSRHLSLASIGLELDVLKKARDSVAHSGILPGPIGKNPCRALDILQSAQFGLQLLLLSELGYKGTVFGPTDKWRERKELGNYTIQN